MKKIIVYILCAVITLSFTACSNNSPSKDSTQKQTIGDNAQIPNPFVDCKTIADANKIVGFTVVAPKNLPTGYSQDTIRAIKDDLVEIIYVKGEKKISFRQGKDSKDISGDYNEYKESNTLTIGSLQVTIKGDNGEVNLAVWTDGDYAYAISSEGLDNNTISDMITSMKSDADDNVQIPNPFIDCATMADAKKQPVLPLLFPQKCRKVMYRSSFRPLKIIWYRFSIKMVKRKFSSAKRKAAKTSAVTTMNIKKTAQSPLAALRYLPKEMMVKLTQPHGLTESIPILLLPISVQQV